MLPSLPIETIENVIKLLDSDVQTTLTCSLLCRALLPACRTLLWQHVVIGKGEYPRIDVEIAELFKILKHSPDIRLYVRSFTLDCGHPPKLSIKHAVDFCAFFPSLRSLTMRNVGVGALPELLTFIDSIPTLEELHLRNVRRDTMLLSISTDVFPSCKEIDKSTSTSDIARKRGKPHLRAFSVVQGLGAQSTALRELLSALERSRHSSSLESLDMLAVTRTKGRGDCSPNTLPQVPSFAPRLTHLGFAFDQFVGMDDLIDANSSRANLQRFLSDLKRCSSLRSLRLQFDCAHAFVMRQFAGPKGGVALPVPLTEPSFFLNALADVLSAPDAPPCPDLERLSFIFLNPVDWLSECGPSFKHLAQACTGLDGAERSSMQRRYPKFGSLQLRFMITAIVTPLSQEMSLQEAHEEFVRDRKRLLLPMLAPFERRGIVVNVSMD